MVAIRFYRQMIAGISLLVLTVSAKINIASKYTAVQVGELATRVYTIDSDSNLVEYVTDSIASTVTGNIALAGSITGATPNSPIQAVWALAAGGLHHLRVFYLNQNGFLYSATWNSDVQKWGIGTLSSRQYGTWDGTGPLYAVASNSLIRVGFHDGDTGDMREAVINVDKDEDASQWQIHTVIPNA